MSTRFFAVVAGLLVVFCSTAFAQSTPTTPKGLLPDAVVTFSVRTNLSIRDTSISVYELPVIAHLSEEHQLAELKIEDVVTRKLAGLVGRLTTKFTFPSMKSFFDWYQRPSTRQLLEELDAVGDVSTELSVERLRVIQPKED
jgi:hypothetical protein